MLAPIFPQLRTAMPRLYALQQRLAVTSAEASALVFLSVVLLVGLGVRYAQSQAVPFSASYYAALDGAFAARTEVPRASAAPIRGAESVETADAAQTDAAQTDAEAPRRPRRAATAGPVRMDLNTASERMLQRLPRVGPKIAARIAEYRAAHGGFREPREIMRVKGIGPKTYEKLAPYLFVGEAGEE